MTSESLLLAERRRKDTVLWSSDSKRKSKEKNEGSWRNEKKNKEHGQSSLLLPPLPPLQELLLCAALDIKLKSVPKILIKNKYLQSYHRRNAAKCKISTIPLITGFFSQKSKHKIRETVHIAC